ncbi:unnamed protein product [Phytophthora fragariaefolia]|uniref:Unnamed protein product n=1 Tax=Phytophthora fragariaefolia TaxID=1490495 RepID=A0A9W6X1Q3_9STRA|nr:unnamed protein product [Phytophthora fragariaefolia]
MEHALDAGASRVAAAPTLPQPPRFEGRSMQDRRDFMHKYETYLGAINALQTQWSGAFAMPVGACIGSKTKRMIARYEFNQLPGAITEEQWVAYFLQAKTPSHVNYTSVDEAMKALRMQTRWPEPESRRMNLQANMEAILDRFNLTDLAFQHEQRRLVKYLAAALAPPGQGCYQYEADVAGEQDHAAQVSAGQPGPSAQSQPRSGSGGHGGNGGRGANTGLGANTGRGAGGGDNTPTRGAHSSPSIRGGRGDQYGRGGCGYGSTRPRESPSQGPTPETRSGRGACLKCGSTASGVSMKFDVVTASDSVLTAGEDRGTVEAAVEGAPVKALLLDSGADTSLVARGVLDSIGQAGKPVAVRTILSVRLSPLGGREVVVQHMATFSEIVFTTSAGPLMLRNLACFVEEDNSRMELTVGRPIMKIRGYSMDKLLVEARDAQAEWELGGDTSPKKDKDQSSSTSLQRICRLAVAAQDPIPDAEEEDIYRHETRWD